MDEEGLAVYGIIGNPLKHSLSPQMHNAAFQALEVDAIYKKFPLEEHELAPFFQTLKEKDCPIFGLNVTVPYKEAVIPFIDSLTPLSEKLKAVNTIVVTKERKLIGYNTDAPGFLTHLSDLNFDVEDKRIVILGSGGSSRAIVATLCMLDKRPTSIKIYNRTPERIHDLIHDLKERIDMSIVEPVPFIDDLNIELADMVINATSLGLKEDDPVLLTEDMLHSHLLVYDLIYNPKKTALLEMAESRGAQIANGLGMLFYQGVLAFQHWADIELGDEVKEIMRESLEQ